MLHLKQYIDNDDSLIVTTVTDWYALRISPEVVSWLRR